MNELVDIVINVDYDDLRNINFPKNELFGLCVNLNGVKYEFLLNLKSNVKNLLVLGSGTIPRDSNHNRSRPYFNRWSWNFQQSTIFYNDPTLYVSDYLLGGWCIGTKNDYYLNNICDIIKIIINSINIKSEDVLFVGSSAGGFQSIMLSILLKGSSALADIPQFDIISYYNNYKHIKYHCFDKFDGDDTEFFEKWGYRFNVMEMMKKEKYIPNVLLILDCTVDYDFYNQYLPFLKQLDKLPFSSNSNNIKIIINGKFKGHTALDYDDLLSLINEHFSKSEIKELVNALNNYVLGK